MKPDPKAIHELAARTQWPEEEVRTIYERELEAADANARVKTFVPIFAQRKTLERLRARASFSRR
jgi:hypothetical protein